MTTRRMAVVPPRYGAEVVGGAELAIAGLGRQFAKRGWAVDVLTTCARSHYTWANEYPAGVSTDGDLTIHRFPTVLDTPGDDRARVERMMHQGVLPSVVDQYRWMNDSLRVPDLFHHLLDHGDQYQAIVLGPYMFWTTFACGQVWPDRSMLWVCAHDEPYLELELFEPLINGVRGLFLQSDPEADLLAVRYPNAAPQAMVGCGVAVPAGYDVEGFRSRHGIGDRRTVLAGGRREGGKGWEAFLAGFTKAVRRGVDLDLVTFGVGDVHAEPDIAPRVIDLGVLSDDELANAFAATDAYVQPSALEAFSMTVMESWLAGTLVIANAASEVVSWHCERSGAGVLYRDDFELEQCLRLVADEPKMAARLAGPGRQYVLDNYTWDAVGDRLEAAVLEWTEGAA